METSQSITADSSRDWIDKKEISKERYLRRNHHRRDRDNVENLIYWGYPDEGKKLIENDGMMDLEKVKKLMKWLIFSKQITCLFLGDQGMGKDACICRLFELVIDYCHKYHLIPPRFVTLGNLQVPPFMSDRDRYFTLKKIPFGKKINYEFPDGEVRIGMQEVWIYSSELEAEFPARDFQGKENKMFSLLQNTFRHNHQKIFGCVKLTANVDISVLRTCNVKIFKYISPEKLNVEGIERENLLTKLGRWFLPRDIKKPWETLLVFDNNLLTLPFRLPTFWSIEYSEQFKAGSIPVEMILDFVRSKFGETDKITSKQINELQTVVYQKFRYDISPTQIKNCFEPTGKAF